MRDNEKILNDAPKGATHYAVLQYDFTEVYIKIEDACTYTLDVDGESWRYIEDLELDGMYQISDLSDIREILERDSEIERLRNKINEFSKTTEQRNEKNIKQGTKQ